MPQATHVILLVGPIFECREAVEELRLSGVKQGVVRAARRKYRQVLRVMDTVGRTQGCL